ncbi:MAG: hypothetical protein LBB06_02170 [Endomicrobium sp.]|jgi:hypothetical protein|nr:hypothetical protein [Endomicrobium sp.]
MDIKEFFEDLEVGKSKIYSLIRMKKIPASTIDRIITKKVFYNKMQFR